MTETVRQPRGEATRSSILHVARRLFSDFGYHHTGIADIQAATGLTKGAFYHHFRAKQDLARAVLDVVREEYRCEVFTPALAQTSPGRRLSALLNQLVELNGRPEWCNCRLLATLFAEMSPADGPLAHDVQNLQAEILERIAGMIAEAQASHEAAPGPPRLWAQLMFSILVGLVLIRKTGAVEADSVAVVALLKDRLLLDPHAAEPHDDHLPRLVHLPGDADCF